MSEKIRTNVMLDKELWRKVRRIAFEQETSASQIMNTLLKQFVKQNRKEIKLIQKAKNPPSKLGGGKAGKKRFP
jgi:predicted transcriptional regulator